MIHFQLYTLSGQKFDDDVYEVILPTTDGLIGVLGHHMPLVTVSTPGVISVRRDQHDGDNKLDHYATYGGVIEIADNNLRVLVDEADHADEINEAEAEAAHKRAEKMKSEAKDQTSLEHAQSMVDRSAVRLQVAGLKRRRTHQR